MHMMDTPLTITHILKRARNFYPKNEIVSRLSDGIFRYTYKDMYDRTLRLASAMTDLGVERGDKVATLAWNDHRHLEAYFAMPVMGAIVHTVNMRLSPEHIIYILNHAQDKVLLFDESLLPIVEGVQAHLTTIKAFVMMTNKNQQELPDTTVHPLYSYEELLANSNSDFTLPDDINENDPCGMCYTSATTGNPKGVVYTHRALFLHSMASGLADTLGLTERDVVLPFVPMFHVNAWGIPYSCTLFGSKQVLPGPAPTPQVLLELYEQEKVTVSAGVPTMWLGMLQILDHTPGKYDTSSIRGLISGGAAAPKGMIKAFKERHNLSILHAYGMTETTPLALASRLRPHLEATLSDDEKLDYAATQGLLVPGLEMKIVNEQGEVAWDGKSMGELLFRGPWIAGEYYKDERTQGAFVDGWLHTGDVATINEEGYVRIVDRTKDLVKSGGEWISSVDIENTLMAHPAVLEAAVIGVAHPKWQERPLAFVVLKEAYKGKVTTEEILEFLTPQFAKWWIPDDVLFIDSIPKTTVGKFLKRSLREDYQNFYN
jgi:fatty-acyl-CoA synthase